jgi:hypothetical protein
MNYSFNTQLTVLKTVTISWVSDEDNDSVCVTGLHAQLDRAARAIVHLCTGTSVIPPKLR